jgi:hypothetical protein
LAKRKGFWASFTDFVYTDLFPQRPMGSDIVSSNAKVVLYGLFALIGFAILTYAITVTSEKLSGIYLVTENNKVPVNDSQKVERLQQLEQINAVYIAAISGSLALGGTLIARLWGRG